MLFALFGSKISNLVPFKTMWTLSNPYIFKICFVVDFILMTRLRTEIGSIRCLINARKCFWWSYRDKYMFYTCKIINTAKNSDIYIEIFTNWSSKFIIHCGIFSIYRWCWISKIAKKIFHYILSSILNNAMALVLVEVFHISKGLGRRTWTLGLFLSMAWLR